MELYIISRHGESTLNFENRINGDPDVPVALTEKGREEAALLGQQIRRVPIELCIHTRFSRTRETASIALEGRSVPFEVEPLLDDVNVGELEGQTLEEYRAWKRERTRSDPFPGGESLDDAARRYAQAFRKLVERPEASILVVAISTSGCTLAFTYGQPQKRFVAHETRRQTASIQAVPSAALIT